MTYPEISADIALRIALAARALPDTDPARLLDVLADAIGLPPTEARLAQLTVKQLKTAADGELGELDPALLKGALAYLKGEAVANSAPPPPVESEEAVPDAIRVACASNGGASLDGHFGSCRRFLIYQVWAGGHRLVATREVGQPAPGEDKNAHRVELIRDCQVLYVASIGGPAAAKVVKADIHPIQFPEGGPAVERVLALQQVLADHPPPWLAKHMGRTPAERTRIALETADT
ncbi:dinitrogenase iron-molybdenum cofactor biosynthesis protein [Thioalkalicoccus limnaeus]|uniref:Dinitrogenase iron-molybdenum cofactor biosynthesis protein n=1 Tax=Thioalkalicoccus limnaeus TaxID=120681 RepID=A0ABV4BHL6_9GAMM